MGRGPGGTRAAQPPGFPWQARGPRRRRRCGPLCLHLCGIWKLIHIDEDIAQRACDAGCMVYGRMDNKVMRLQYGFCVMQVHVNHVMQTHVICRFWRMICVQNLYCIVMQKYKIVGPKRDRKGAKTHRP